MADIISSAAPTLSPPAASILHHTSVDFAARSPTPALPVHLVQYDQTLPMLAVALYYDGRPYVLPAGAAVNIRMDKRDGHYVYNPALGVDDARTTAYIAVTQQMTTGAGDFAPILEIVVDGGIAGTAPLSLCIDRNPVPQDAVESRDEYKTIEQLAAEVTANAAVAVASADAAATSQSQAAGSATQAAGSAAAAATSQNQAAASATSAASSATAANSSKTAAAQSATAASQSATAAANSADAAAAYAASIDPESLVSKDYVTAAVAAAASTSYTVTVPASAWTAGSLTHLGQTYAYKDAVTVAAAKGAGKGLIVEPASGSAADLQAWGVLDVTEGTVTVWSKTALTGSITLTITEVR